MRERRQVQLKPTKKPNPTVKVHYGSCAHGFHCLECCAQAWRWV